MAQVLRPLSGLFNPIDYPALLVGLSEPDDAAVYQLDDQTAIVSTVDFFPPVVDDPYSFGAIAAANALSDIYAMGGRPIMAINLAAFPDHLDRNILSEILQGGADKVKEAGAVIAGGHTVTDQEPKYGLAVTGLINPRKILTKGGAKAGDTLILTKSLGTGVITTALKRGLSHDSHVTAAIQSMTRLNSVASQLAIQHETHAMTDITGFGFVGHAHEMAHMSGTDFHIYHSRINWLPGAITNAEQDVFPGGQQRNKDYFDKWITVSETVPVACQNLLFDPQTSGGLLISLPETSAHNLRSALVEHGEVAEIVGHVTDGTGFVHITI